MLYKCPGPHRGPNGLCYQFIGTFEGADAEALTLAGWRGTIREAAELGGANSFMKPKPVKKKRGENKYKYGLPSAPAETDDDEVPSFEAEIKEPIAPEVIEEIKAPEPEQEKPVYRVLTHDEPIDEPIAPKKRGRPARANK